LSAALAAERDRPIGGHRNAQRARLARAPRAGDARERVERYDAGARVAALAFLALRTGGPDGALCSGGASRSSRARRPRLARLALRPRDVPDERLLMAPARGRNAQPTALRLAGMDGRAVAAAIGRRIRDAGGADDRRDRGQDDHGAASSTSLHVSSFGSGSRGIPSGRAAA
jgi:hypothetical protein